MYHKVPSNSKVSSIQSKQRKLEMSQNQRERQGVLKKSAVTGVAVVMEMLSGGLFMENVKMEKQRTSLPYPTLMRSILSQGVKGFEAGFWPWGFVLGMTKGTVLGGSRAFLLNICEDTLRMGKESADLASGFGAGAVQGVFMSPILLARTRVNQSLMERASKGVVNTGFLAEMKLSTTILNQAIREEGLSVLTTGMPAMVFKRAMDWGTRFIFFGIYRRSFEARKPEGVPLEDWEKLAASFLGGATSVAITMPVDRMMPILQQAGASNESFLTIMKKKVQTEGVFTLQRGFLMRTIHTGYHTMFAIFIANKIYALLE